MTAFEKRIGERLPLRFILPSIQCGISTAVLCTLMLLAALSASATTVVVKPTSEAQLIGKSVAYLKDDVGNLSIEKVLSDSLQSRFTLQEKDVFTRPAGLNTYWFKITIDNQSLEKAWLEVNTTFIWYLDFYAPVQGKYECTTSTGALRPEQTKAYPTNLYWMPLADTAASITYYLRAETRRPYEVPMFVGTSKALLKNKRKQDFVFDAYIGILLIMFFYNASLFFSTKDKIYLWYILCVFTNGIAVIYLNKYPILTTSFGFDIKFWMNRYVIVWFTPLYIGSAGFGIKFLELAKRTPIFCKALYALLFVIMIVLPVCNLADWIAYYTLTKTLQLLTFILYFSLLGVGVYLWVKQKQLNARFYVLGWTGFLLCIIGYILSTNGTLPYNFWTRNSMFFGSALEIFLFSIALGDRIKVLRKNNERIQQENYALIKEHNAELEERVAERTQELEEQQEELRQINDNKDRLFAIIGHDLKGPINSLKSLMGLVSQKHVSQEEFQMLSENLKLDVESVHTTLTNLLYWARNHLQGIVSHPSSFLLGNLVRSNTDLLEGLASAKALHIENTVDEQIKVNADKDQISLVLRNLISNAIKYTRENGRIVILCAEEEHQWVIQVEDNGIGIPNDKLSSLFDEKDVLIIPDTEGKVGTGLGLMLCKEFVEANGGKIWAESELDKGSKFVFSIPR